MSRYSVTSPFIATLMLITGSASASSLGVVTYTFQGNSFEIVEPYVLPDYLIGASQSRLDYYTSPGPALPYNLMFDETLYGKTLADHSLSLVGGENTPVLTITDELGLITTIQGPEYQSFDSGLWSPLLSIALPGKAFSGLSGVLYGSCGLDFDENAEISSWSCINLEIYDGQSFTTAITSNGDGKKGNLYYFDSSPFYRAPAVTCPARLPQFNVEFAHPFEGANKCERADLARPRLLG